MQNRAKLLADRVAEQAFRHADSASVVRNHFSYKIAVNIIGLAYILHFAKHSLRDLPVTPLVQVPVTFTVRTFATGFQDTLHILNAFCLFGNNICRYILQRDACGIL